MTADAAKPPAVSVVIPAHNDQRYVGECVESILSQTLSEFQLIIVDDGSTDDTGKIADGYAAGDDRVMVIHKVEKTGRGAARNAGIEAATAELIAFQDADDLSAPDRLERQKAFLDAHPEVGLVASPYMLVDEHGAEVGVKPLRRTGAALAEHMRRYCAISHCAALFRTEVVRAVGGYRNGFAQSQDYDMLLRILERAEVGVLDVPFYKYRQVPCGVSMGRVEAANRSKEIAREFARQRAERGTDEYEVYLAAGKMPRILGAEAPASYADYYYRLSRMALDCREYGAMLRYVRLGLRGRPSWLVKYAFLLAAGAVHFVLRTVGLLDWFERTFRAR